MAHTVTANFWEDYIESLKSHLHSKGLITSGNEQDKDFFIAHFNWLGRRVPPKARTVHVPQNFQAPSQFNSVVQTIISDIKAGLDIQPRLSRRIIDWASTDAMLSDWGIYHLHLGSSLDADGFVNRTGPLLFARFSEANAYLLGVFNHNSWTNQDLIEIIHANWPSTIKKHKMDVQQLTWQPSSDERMALRAMNINTSVQLRDGTIYQPIGGGMASDGTPLDISSKLVTYKRKIRQAQEGAEAKLLEQLDGSKPDMNLMMRLELSGANAFAVEDTTAFREKLW